jgi:hypothetical protein
MKTDELIAALATNVEPADPRRFSRALTWLLAGGVAVAAGLMLQEMGLNPDLPAYLGRGMFWVKLGFGMAVAALALWGVVRMARPGRPVGLAARAWLVPIVALSSLGVVALWLAPAADRTALVFGATWRVCSFNIALLSLPMLLAGLVALRAAAPTQPARAGAAAGLLAGGAAAAVYALHCPELAAPFLAVWYVAGVLIPAAAGALLGRPVLRW